MLILPLCYGSFWYCGYGTIKGLNILSRNVFNFYFSQIFTSGKRTLFNWKFLKIMKFPFTKSEYCTLLCLLTYALAIAMYILIYCFSMLLTGCAYMFNKPWHVGHLCLCSHCASLFVLHFLTVAVGLSVSVPLGIIQLPNMYLSQWIIVCSHLLAELHYLYYFNVYAPALVWTVAFAVLPCSVMAFLSVMLLSRKREGAAQ